MKNLIYLLLLTMALAGCSSTDQTAEKNLAAAKEMFAAFNGHDWKKMASFYADTAEFLDPAFGIDYVKKTRKETAEKYAGMQQMFPDINDNITDISASGDRVTVQFVSSGTPAGQAKWYLPICSVLTFKDGKIIKDATYYDNE
ncbi:nuclear transport factor 2 family protein [Mucilaginibacter limnophilus]|uniref:Nuclear transport factor 2 family protein n=1 Tax=Mucilaginibacter limnophilus TaxID=1932778 RepID=A0A3S2UKH6_9SPHI|nr:nuclear transport factor 2 family protein [Mucilaginibacter limnophilus]RVT99841.1 nuclear transport factor 2 family protein [Mucilaginibacter limnophilus]